MVVTQVVNAVVDDGLQSTVSSPAIGANLSALRVASEIWRPVSLFRFTSMPVTAFRFLRSMLLTESLAMSRESTLVTA